MSDADHGSQPRRGRAALTCHECGSTEIVPVVFGLPGPELAERASRGEVALGGCMVDPDVRGQCKQCGAWLRRG